MHVNHMGTLPGYRMVCFSREGISNILSVSNATKKDPISYDSEYGDMSILHKSEKQLVFNRIQSGLYSHDVRYWYIPMVATVIGNREV